MNPRSSIANLPPSLNLRSLKSYLSSGELDRARDLFDKIPKPDLCSLTLLISAYTRQNLPKESIKLYWNARKEKGLVPDKLVLLSVAKACASSRDLVKAKELHEEAVKHGFKSDLFLGNAIIDMYGKCGFLGGAKRVFDELPHKDVISWTSLISTCVNSRIPLQGLQVFRDMVHFGMKPNTVTLSTVLRVCSEIKALNSASEIHSFALRNGLEDDLYVCSALVDTYANCSKVQNARAVFNLMPRKDTISIIVMLGAYFANGYCEEALKVFDRMKSERIAINSASWNCMISGLVQNGKPEQSFQMLQEMQQSGFKPNNITLASVLSALSYIQNLRGGREVHGYILRHLYLDDLTVLTALLLMYAKCGDLVKSRDVFKLMPRKDTFAWNTMMLANSMHGNGEDAVSVYNQMLESGAKPNSVTFTVLLSGCSHSQLVDTAKLVFHSMSRDHGIQPDVDHYACMVDVLCRSGHLKEAYEFIHIMPMKPTASAWGALLAACRVYKNVELGKLAAEQLLEIEPENPGNYVQLSNILVASKQWDDASRIRLLMRDKMRDRGFTKVPGCSWIQARSKIYTFVKGDDKNTQRDEIYSFLKEMNEKMKLEGYLPDTDFVLQNVNREEKEELLCSHSEKLAVAFGILNLRGESVIRVFKNLRICGDCHNAINIMAKILQLQIIVRDNVRFHHFKDGKCSCRNMW